MKKNKSDHVKIFTFAKKFKDNYYSFRFASVMKIQNKLLNVLLSVLYICIVLYN